MIWMKIELTNDLITTAKTIFNKDDHEAATFSPTCSNHSSTEVKLHQYLCKNSYKNSWDRKKFVVALQQRIKFNHNQGSYFFELFRFHDFLWLCPWPFAVFQEFRYSCHLKKIFQNYPGFKVFWPNSDQQITQVSDKICAIFKKLFNYVFLSLFWSVHELI